MSIDKPVPVTLAYAQNTLNANVTYEVLTFTHVIYNTPVGAAFKRCSQNFRTEVNNIKKQKQINNSNKVKMYRSIYCVKLLSETLEHITLV